MISQKNNAWYDKTVVPSEMVKGARAEIQGWKVLEKTSHFKPLDMIIRSLNGEKLIDIGCGAGEIGRIYKNLKYTGVDLDHIIESVSKKVNPELNYFKFDATESDFKFVSDYDIILMNGFLSEMENPLDIIAKILKHANKHIVIHRQDFNDDETQIKEYKSYGGKIATNSSIKFSDFNSILMNYGFKIKECIDSTLENKKTILLSKNG